MFWANSSDSFGAFECISRVGTFQSVTSAGERHWQYSSSMREKSSFGIGITVTFAGFWRGCVLLWSDSSCWSSVFLSFLPAGPPLVFWGMLLPNIGPCYSVLHVLVLKISFSPTQMFLVPASYFIKVFSVQYFSPLFWSGCHWRLLGR